VIKLGVRVHGLRPELVLAIIVAKDVWMDQGTHLVVTSVIDGVHKSGSAHYSGRAVDLRSHELQDPARAQVALAAALGPDFDVVLEGVGTPGAHIHVEFDPKSPY